MTLIPFPHHHEIHPAIGENYRVGPYCERPGCTHFADHAHHAVRRSFIGGDIKWIEYQGEYIKNLVALCSEHHRQITENESFLFWVGPDKTFYWYDQTDEEPAIRVGPLAGTVRAVAVAPDEFDGPASKPKCPTCKRAMPKEKEKTEEKRPRRTWAVTVPVDERENGAEVLDTLLEECASIFGHDESRQVKYFTLCQALALVIQHKEMLT